MNETRSETEYGHDYSTGKAQLPEQERSKPRPVIVAKAEMNDAVNHLADVVGNLRARLEPVLGPAEPVALEDGDPAKNSYSDVTLHLIGLTTAINFSIAELNQILRRLEI